MCGTDLDVFTYAPEQGRREELIAVYVRRETERRAVGLAIAGLAVLAECRPTIRPVLFGSRQDPKLPSRPRTSTSCTRAAWRSSAWRPRSG